VAHVLDVRLLVPVVLISARISLTTKLSAALRKVIERLYCLDTADCQVVLFQVSRKTTFQARMATSDLGEQTYGLVGLATIPSLQKASLDRLTMLIDVI
jgi:hypothetical protein